MGIFWSVLSKIISIIIFLVLLALLNIFAPSVNNLAFSRLIAFLNSNVLLIIFIAVLFMVADVFWSLAFPLDLPFPLFNAIGAVFLTVFIIRLLGLVDSLIGTRIFGFVNQLAPLIYTVVFILALIFGYAEIFSARKHERRHVVRRE